MSDRHPSAGIDRLTALFRAQRLDEVNAPARVHRHLTAAADVIDSMPDDGDRALALVILHCARAICCATDNRT